jgi:hypothetical protein
MKNPHWFTDKNDADSFNDGDFLADVQSSSSLAVLKHQLVVLSKLYRNQLQARTLSPVKNRRSTASNTGKQKSGRNKHDIDPVTNNSQDDE